MKETARRRQKKTDRLTEGGTVRGREVESRENQRQRDRQRKTSRTKREGEKE